MLQLPDVRCCVYILGIRIMATTVFINMMFQIVLVAALSCVASATVSHGGASQSSGAPVGYQGPLANPVLQADGHIADTAEVAAAKGAHLVAVAKERATSAYAGGNNDDGSGSGGFGGAGAGAGAGHGGAGAFSYGPGTSDVYRGQNGYAGLNSAAGQGGAHSEVNSYGPGTADVYSGQNGYAGLSSAASGQGAYKH